MVVFGGDSGRIVMNSTFDEFMKLVGNVVYYWAEYQVRQNLSADESSNSYLEYSEATSQLVTYIQEHM